MTLRFQPLISTGLDPELYSSTNSRVSGLTWPEPDVRSSSINSLITTWANARELSSRLAAPTNTYKLARMALIDRRSLATELKRLTTARLLRFGRPQFSHCKK